MDLRYIHDNFFQKDIKVYLKDGRNFTGYFRDMETEFDSTSGEDEIDLDMGDLIMGIPMSIIKEVEEIK